MTTPAAVKAVAEAMQQSQADSRRNPSGNWQRLARAAIEAARPFLRAEWEAESR